MSHDYLCPRNSKFLAKCQCALIERVRNDLVDLIQKHSPEFNESKSRWYYSGRQDAAENIEELMHELPCDCDTCVILVTAYKAALGTMR